nr:cobalt ABC transporter permease [Propionibacterium sp.]
MSGHGTMGAPAARLGGRRGPAWWLVGLGVALLCAGVLSGFASASPDGLEWVTERLGFSAAAAEPVVAGPLAGYQVAGVTDGALSGGLAGVVGTLVVLAVGLLLARLLRRSAA